MITAKEAREMSGTSAEYYLEFIEKKIIDAAKNKEKYVIIRDEPYCRFLCIDKRNTQEIRKVIETLEDNGFKLKMYLVEFFSDFDMGIVIEWR